MKEWDIRLLKVIKCASHKWNRSKISSWHNEADLWKSINTCSPSFLLTYVRIHIRGCNSGEKRAKRKLLCYLYKEDGLFRAPGRWEHRWKIIHIHDSDDKIPSSNLGEMVALVKLSSLNSYILYSQPSIIALLFSQAFSFFCYFLLSYWFLTFYHHILSMNGSFPPQSLVSIEKSLRFNKMMSLGSRYRKLKLISAILLHLLRFPIIIPHSCKNITNIIRETPTFSPGLMLPENYKCFPGGTLPKLRNTFRLCVFHPKTE